MATYKYKLLGGTHTGSERNEDGTYVTYVFDKNTPTYFESDNPDLEETFGSAHVERVGEGPSAAPKKGKTTKAGPPGDDVTSEFEGAAEAGFLVHKDGRNFCVYDASDPSEPLHDNELTTKTAVKTFIKDNTE